MKLLHIIPRFLGGGPERHLLALVAAWREAGHLAEHTVAVLDTPVSARLVVQARRLGMRLLVKPDRAALDAAIETSDVVEIAYWNHPLLLDRLQRELPPARVLLVCAVAGSTLPQVLFAELGAIADAMVLTSQRSRSTPAVRTAASHARLVEHVPMLADMSRVGGFQPRAHAGIRVGYLGLLEPTKMHPRFAELSAGVRTRGLRFDIFGDGAGGPQLAQRFEALGAAGRVQFHGHAEDLREALSEIDIFGYPLAPASYATADKALQEAMWVGIPPVVLGGTGAAEFVEHERTGLVCDDEDGYPRAIERLAEDADLRRRLGEAAKEFAHEHFDPARNAVRFHGIFEATATRPLRRRDPLPGANEPAAGRFVLSLGDLAGPFATSLDRGQTNMAASSSIQSLIEAEAAVARSSAVLARGEGGVNHYRNTYPDDPHLRLWSGLIARHAGDTETAAAEFAAAAALGVSPHF